MSKKIREIRIEGNIAYVPLTQGYEAVIDAADVPLVEGVNWFAQVDMRKDGTIKNIYAARTARLGGGKQRVVYMHRLLSKAADGVLTDHRDGVGLNNRSTNLRFATVSQNGQNQRIGTKNKSGRKGVWWDSRRGKWQSRIVLHGRARFLGYFASVDEAAAAYAAASAVVHGEFGRVS